MPAGTINSQQGRHVAGEMVWRFFNYSGASGTTLNTGQRNVYFVGVQPGSVITGFTQAQSTDGANTTILTLTSSGAMTNEIIMVISRVG